jgi:hypothetical protein
MKSALTTALASGVSLLMCAQVVSAQEAGARFSWEGEIELGVESVIDSDVSANKTDDPFVTVEIVGEAALSDNVSLFAGLTLEEMTGPSSGIDDLGLYVHEIGLTFGAAFGDVTVGKFGPVFGAAWDETAGYFGSTLAEDYELTEMIGLGLERELNGAGTLSFAVFFADDTALSESAFFNRGRNDSDTAGGAGNTGRLDNVALSWSHEIGDTRFMLGARHLSAGAGDVSDETGFVGAVGHSLANGLDLYAEAAVFDGFGGTGDDANYLTVNAAYGIGSTTLSGTYARRDIDGAGVTDLVSFGAEREFGNGMTLGGALAWVDDAGTCDTVLGVNLLIPLGG